MSENVKTAFNFLSTGGKRNEQLILKLKMAEEMGWQVKLIFERNSNQNIEALIVI